MIPPDAQRPEPERPMPTSTKQLSFKPDTNMFYGDLSECPLIRIYPDACDLGLELLSERTGEVAKFAVCGEDRDPNENELMAIYLKPTAETLRRLPRLNGCRITLFND
jgi:hypothetical protein